MTSKRSDEPASECADRVAAEYRRQMLEEFDLRESQLVVPDELLRLQFEQMFLAEGIAPTKEQLDDVLLTHKEGDRKFQTALTEVTNTITSFVPDIARQEIRIGGGLIRQGKCVGSFLYPTGVFNAKTIPTDDGDYLILVNAGLVGLLWQATKILTWTTQLDETNFSVP